MGDLTCSVRHIDSNKSTNLTVIIHVLLTMLRNLIFSFLSFKTLSSVPAKQTAVVPVFNIPRQDFCLRTEAVFLFKQFHLDHDFFTFIEDIELETLMETKKLKLTLVDHNVLAQAQKYLETAVIEILGECVSKHYRSALYKHV